LFAPYLSKKGYNVIHVQSSEEIPSIFKPSYSPDDYAMNIPYYNNIEQLVVYLKEINPFAIVAGAESGIALSDTLAYKLSLPYNTNNLKSVRESKGCLIDRLSECGFLVPKQQKIKSVVEIKEWVDSLSADDWPVVIKPQDSAASDGLFLCNNISECENAVASILNKCNIIGRKNSEILAQSYLLGAQYIVNTISWKGKHQVTDIWFTNKRRFDKTKQILEDRILLDPSISPVSELIYYTKSCLDVMGVKFGASHVELIMTKNGPVMIEVNGRPMGGGMPIDLFNASLGSNHVYQTADVYIDDNNVRKNSLDETIYKPQKYMAIIDFTFRRDSIVDNHNGLELAKTLRSYYQSYNVPVIGSLVNMTADTVAGQGYMCLLHQDPVQVFNDLQLIRQLKINNELIGVVAV
jgi:biotin carboxylase